MCLKIVTKLSSGDQECVGKLLNFYISCVSSQENFTNIIYQFLDFVLFSDRYRTYYCWRDEKVYDKLLFANGRNYKQGWRAEIFFQLLECYFGFIIPLEGLIFSQDFKEWEALVS